MKTVDYQHENLLDGKKVKLHYPIADQEFKDQLIEIFEKQHYRNAKNRGGEVFLDIGANVGMVSLYVKDKFKRIVAIEPNPDNFEALKKNTEKYDHIECYNYAILIKDTTEKMASVDKHSTAQTFFPSKPVVNTVEVKTRRLDSVFNELELDQVDVMKIDVEGAEYVIFAHEAFADVSGSIGAIIGEGHYTSTMSFPEIIPVMLEDHDYETKFLEFDPPNYVRFLNYKDPYTGEEKEWKKSFNTIFWATRV